MKTQNKSSKLLTIIFSLFTIFAAISCFAQGQGTGGGEGSVVAGKLYLLDFVTGGIYNRGDELGFKSMIERYRQDQSAEKKNMLDKWDSTFRKLPFSPEIKEAIAAKLLSMRRPYRFALYAPLDLYSWNMVPYNPVPSATDGKTPLQSDQPLTIALRKNHSILIGEKRFAELDLFNQVGLIFHELFYALSTPYETSPGKFNQLSWLAQEVTAAVFKDNQQYNDVNLERYKYSNVSSTKEIPLFPFTTLEEHQIPGDINYRTFGGWNSFLNSITFNESLFVSAEFSDFIGISIPSVSAKSYEEQWLFSIDIESLYAGKLRTSADNFEDALVHQTSPQSGGYDAALWEHISFLCGKASNSIEIRPIYYHVNFKFGSYLSEDGTHQFIQMEDPAKSWGGSGSEVVQFKNQNDCETKLKTSIVNVAKFMAKSAM